MDVSPILGGQIDIEEKITYKSKKILLANVSKTNIISYLNIIISLILTKNIVEVFL